MYLHSGATTKRKRQYEDKLSDWAAGRASLVNLQKEAFEQKQRLEMAMKKEEFEKKMAIELAILQLQKEEQEARTSTKRTSIKQTKFHHFIQYIQ